MNGFIIYAPDNVSLYDIGTVATYECNPGFLLVGDMTRDCVGIDVNTAEFNREAPVCERKKYLNSSVNVCCKIPYFLKRA